MTLRRPEHEPENTPPTQDIASGDRALDAQRSTLFYDKLKPLRARKFANDTVGFDVDDMGTSAIEKLKRHCRDLHFEAAYDAIVDNRMWLVIIGPNALTRLADNGVNYPDSSSYLSRSL